VMQDEYERSKREHFDGFLRKPVLRYDLFNELSKYLAFEKEERDQETKQEEFVLSEKAKQNISTILELLTTDIKKLQLQAIETNSISDIKTFASEIKSLAIKFEIEPLDKYAAKLYMAIDSFDIVILEELLNSYDELVEKFLKY